MKKLYGGIVKDLLEEKDTSYDKLASADFAEAGRRLLKKLRAGVPKKRLEGQLKDNANKNHNGKSTPIFHPDGSPFLVRDIVNSDLTIVRVEIQREKRKFVTTEKDIVTTDSKNKIVTN